MLHAVATPLHGAGLFVIMVTKQIVGAICAYCQLDTFYLPSIYLQRHSCDVLNQALPPISVLGGQRSNIVIVCEEEGEPGNEASSC